MNILAIGAHPDDVETFHWPVCPFVDLTKPDGN